MLRKFRVLLGKELLEFKREAKILLLIVASAWVLPALVAFTTSAQKASVVRLAIVACDEGTAFNVSIDDVVGAIADSISKCPFVTVETSILACRGNTSGFDVVVEIPRGFMENLTLFRVPVKLFIYYNPRSTAAQRVYDWIVYVTIPSVSRMFSEKLVSHMLWRLGIQAEPSAVLDPVHAVTGFIGVAPEAGRKVTRLMKIAGELAFATIFVFAPSAIIAVDIIVREKERRNLEILLATPLTPAEIMLVKTIASSLVGIVAGLADAAAALVYLHLIGFSTTIPSTWGLVIIHALATFLAILATASLTQLPLMLGSSSRTALLTAGVYTTVAFFVYMLALTTDYTRLPAPYQALLALIPYTHSVNAILYLAKGEIVASIVSIIALTGYILAAHLIAFAFAKPERIVRSV